MQSQILHSQHPRVASYPGNPLPWQLTSLIGRELELAAVKEHLAATRLLTLTGPGGSGKTRLAAQLAADLRATPDQFPNGVWWVDLAALTDETLVPQAVASALGVREQPGRPLVETLTDELHDRQALLVFDNCEHLIAASAALVYSLLGACPGLRLVATSREPLGVLGETVWPVPPLAWPESVSDPAGLLEFGAVRLFVERAQQALPAFALTAETASAVAQICRRLDGIPLALELAAARVRVLNVVEMAGRLDDVFRLLAGAPRHLPARHQTLRATVDWSYNLLSPQEQRLFRRLGVFAGGFTLAAIEMVCTDAPSSIPDVITATDVVEWMTLLVDKSLVVVTPSEGPETRYRLLETIRQYTRHKLGDEALAMRQRHLAWAVTLGEQAEKKMQGPDLRAWLTRLEREHDNLRAALGWGLGVTEEGLGSPSATALTSIAIVPPASTLDAVRLAGSLGWFWALRGYLSEGRRWVEAALQVLPSPSPALSAARATAFYAGGILAAAQGDVVAAGSYLQNSLTLGWELGDARVIGQALLTMGAGVLWQGQPGPARMLLEQSLTHLRQADDRWGQAAALAWLGEVARGAEQYAEASEAYAESLRLFQQLGDPWGECWPLIGQAHLALQQRDYPLAGALYGRCEAVFREFGERWGLGAALNGLAEVARGLGDIAQASRLYRAALDVNREIGFQVGAALSLTGLALCAAPSQPLTAARLLGAAAALQDRIGAHIDSWRQDAVGGLTARLRQTLGDSAYDTAFAQGAGSRDEGLEITDGGRKTKDERPKTEDEGKSLQSLVPTLLSSVLRPPSEAVRLRLLALGPVEVHREGRALAASDWTYTKPRELLFYLLSHSRQTKEQIGLALWPDASASQLRSNFRTALYHLRRALGDTDWILFEDEHYLFNRDLGYWYDVEVFERGLKGVKAYRDLSPADASTALNALVALYRGDFLADMDSGEWVDLKREEVRQSFLDALLVLGAAQTAQARYADAAATYRRAITQDSYLEAAHRELMRCLARQGEAGQALRHYQALSQLLHDELDAPPASETQALYEQLRRGEIMP
ncbi:MAG: AAA family ATPase [Anaerolineae bacterium]|nr:AAA family ATPase [Anaerolineae bacterium]